MNDGIKTLFACVLLGADGGVFAYGGAQFLGAALEG
jgi:hypothetical protein